MKSIFYALIAGSFMLFLVSCNSQINREQNTVKKIIFAIPVKYSTLGQEKNFDRVAKYLSENLNAELNIITTKDISEEKEGLSSGKIDIALIHSQDYKKIKQAVPDLSYIATAKTYDRFWKPSLYYHSYIISLKTSSIKKIQDLHGKKLAFGPHGSLGTHYSFVDFLEKNQINFDKTGSLYDVAYSKSIKLLIDEKVDACVVIGTAFAYDEKKYGEIFNTLAVLDPFPEFPIVGSPKLSPELTEKISELLNNIPEKIFGNWHIRGFGKIDPVLYMQKD